MTQEKVVSAPNSVEQNDQTVIGKITSVYGVKGWVKVFSYTQPKENIRDYRSWTIQRGKESKQVSVLECKSHGNGLIARLEGCNNRELARTYSDFLIKVPTSELPELDSGDYYWHQLEGLLVSAVRAHSNDDSGASCSNTDGVQEKGANESELLLGRVHHMMETGANDVMVIKPCTGSIDTKERLVPYLVDQVVKYVDLEEGKISVDWDPEF